MSADDLISEARCKSGRLVEPPSSEAVGELYKILQYNDSVPRSRRISRARALEMLRDEHGYTASSQTFDRWLREELDRGWHG